MAFCRGCGNEVANEAKFCRNCGKEVDLERHARLQKTSEYAEKKSKLRFLRFSSSIPLFSKFQKKHFLLVAVSLVAVVLLFSSYFLIANRLSAEKIINRFEEAIVHKDSKALIHIFHSTDEELNIDQGMIDNFLMYAETDPVAVNELIGNLREQAAILEDSSTNPSLLMYDAASIRLEKHGKRFLFFDNYQITVSGVHLTLFTNYKDVSLLVDGEEVAVSDAEGFEIIVGPYLPGIYEIEAKLDTGFVESSTTQTVWAVNTEEVNYISLNLDAEEITIYTGLDAPLEGKLFINGKDVGINPFESNVFGPVTTDGSMSLAIEAEFPWGTMRSEEVPITYTEIVIDMGHVNDAAFKEQIMQKVATFYREELEALTSGDVSKMTGVTDNMRTRIQEQIDYSREYNRIYKSTYHGAKFDGDSFTVYQEDNVWRLGVVSINNYTTNEYTAGSWSEEFSIGEGRSNALAYDETTGTWLMDVSDMFNDFYDESEFSDNLMELEEEDPITYTVSLPADSADVNLDMSSSFLNNYLSSSVAAINERDFARVSPLMDPAGPAYNETSSYIDYLEEKGITEELLSSSVIRFEQLDNQTYQVETNESYNIIYSDGTVKKKNYNSVYKVVFIDNELLLHQLISTKETSSTD